MHAPLFLVCAGAGNRILCLVHYIPLNRIVQFSSVVQSCPTLRDPVDCSTPDLPVHHQLPELAQTHVHRVGDAIQPSHLLSSPEHSHSSFVVPVSV